MSPVVIKPEYRTRKEITARAGWQDWRTCKKKIAKSGFPAYKMDGQWIMLESDYQAWLIKGQRP